MSPLQRRPSGGYAPLTDVNVVIPVWNRAQTVRRAIDSVLSQQVAGSDIHFNVTVVDDGSTDGLTATLTDFGAKVRCIRHDSNQGAAAARNTGIEASQERYVAFLDSDDVWMPDKLAAQLAFMRDTGCRASCTSYFLSFAGGDSFVSPNYATGMLTHADLLWGCRVSPGSTLICERAVFDEVGLLDTAFERLEDWDWLLRYANVSDLGFLAQPLAKVVVGPRSDASRIPGAVQHLRSKHLANLSKSEVRVLEAAIALEIAAAYYRSGHRMQALPAVLKSLMIVPFGNQALAAVLRNRIRSNVRHRGTA